MDKRRLVTACTCTVISCALALLPIACSDNQPTDSTTRSVPHEGRWGLYSLDLSTQDVALLYSSSDEIDDLNLSNSGDRIAFAMKSQAGVDLDTTSEIYSISVNGEGLIRLTNNRVFDTYPSFSPNDSQIVFLSLRDSSLDLFVMNADGTNQHVLYSSSGHDADCDWGSAGRIAFTRDHQIWSVTSEGADPRQVTDPPNAGLWGDANLPIGDYDPRFSPDGATIAFERLVDVSYPHGGYDIYRASSDGGDETRLTTTGSLGYALGFPNWSYSGDRLVYILAAIGSEGKYDLWMINSDGSQNHVITPEYFPAEFLCHNAVFSIDDSKIYFIGEWWQ